MTKHESPPPARGSAGSAGKRCSPAAGAQRVCLQGRIPPEWAGERLDKVLARLFDDYSRACLQHWLKQGWVTVEGHPRRGRDKVAGGEQVVVDAPLEAEVSWRPEVFPLSVVYEDEALLVIDKPPGLVVHPGAGNRHGTLLNALLHHAPELAQLPRAGIVHRLDKGTSGLLVVARTLAAHHALTAQLRRREFRREYRALVCGVLTGGGTVKAPIGRHPVQRTRMAVREGGRPAVTHYRVEERFRAHTWLRVLLETGRTHQIRVHMAHLRHPVVGDLVYGGRLRLPPQCSPALAEVLRGLRRQALHAARLSLTHPERGTPMHWESPLPEDLADLLAALRADRQVQPE